MATVCGRYVIGLPAHTENNLSSSAPVHQVVSLSSAEVIHWREGRSGEVPEPWPLESMASLMVQSQALYPASFWSEGSYSACCQHRPDGYFPVSGSQARWFLLFSLLSFYTVAQ